MLTLPSFTNMYRLCASLLLTICSVNLHAQVTYTANDQVTTYTGKFAPGYNAGYFPGWNDQTLSDLAAGNPALGVSGAGTRSTRQGLFYDLLKTWGYGVRLPEVQHYQSLGMGEFTALILGGANGSAAAPPDAVRDNTEFCIGYRSELFANLYLPIWDSGANGTPYNDDNFYAAYLYETVKTYKDYVRFWEIWNEPGFDYANIGWRPAGDPAGNWWDNNPQPCEYKLRAPIFHYIRMLRISWEIVKTLDPDAYVCLGAPGYPSFVDAIIRNTDNPGDGSVNNDYPLKGGAYFDAVAYHSYPHFDNSTLLNPVTLTYLRTSDQCAKGITAYRDRLQAALAARGYDGSMYPKKEYIVTECNVPRRSFGAGDSFGSEEIQRNFIIKGMIECKKQRIHQLHFFALSELKPDNIATNEFDVMGLYRNLANVAPADVVINNEGVALKTVSKLLFDTEYDPARSQALNAPAGVHADAFKDTAGKYWYAIWAEPMGDLSEAAAATYSFPAGLTGSNLKRHRWNWSTSQQTTNIAPTNINLTASPLILYDDGIVPTTAPYQGLAARAFPNPAKDRFTLQLDGIRDNEITLRLSNLHGEMLLAQAHTIVQNGRVEVILATDMPAGMYFVQVVGAQQVWSGKVEIE